MDLHKNKTQFFHYIFYILLLNIISKIYCLIELPLSKINSKNIPKYPNFNPDTSIPEYIRNKIIIKKQNFMGINKINMYTSSGELIIIPNLLFAIDVKLGTSKQLFNLLIDTGSSITWVPLKNSNDLYPLSHHYDPSISSTSKKKSEDSFEIVYGSGSAYGNYYSDQVTYIDNKEFMMDFGAAYKTNFLVNGADGILGLSRIYDDYDKSFINMICKGHVTESKLFSVKLGLNSIKNNNGTFYIGKHEDFDKENVVSCELNTDNYYEINYWACDIYSLSVESEKNNFKINSEKKISAIFDTGTNAIFLPYFYLQSMISELEKINCFVKKYETIAQPNRYQIICMNDLPDFKLNIGGHTFILLGQYFFSYEKGFYFSDIYFQDSIDSNDDVFIIGSPFFIFFHVLFDSYSKELFFYPEIEGTIIKGSWWNSKHIIIFIIFCGIIIFTVGLIVFFIFWKRKNKLDLEQKLGEKFEIRSYFGLL